MATLNEMAGTLIELNVHIQRTKASGYIMFFGLVAAFFSFIALVSYLDKPKQYIRALLICALVFLAGVSSFIYGYNMPTEKIISYCANGPVSIEQINAQYDIVEIDGKLIRLKERR